MISDWFYGLPIPVLFLAFVVLIAGAADVGNWIGLRFGGGKDENADVGTLAAACLGLLALLIAFSFSMAEARYETRRTWVLEEATAIGSTANFALMLPEPAQHAILGLLRDYSAVRIGLDASFDPLQMEQDINRSLELQSRLWQQAVAVTAAAPQSLPAYRFVASLNEMNNIHERRIIALRNRLPSAVVFMLIGTAMVAMGFTGYNSGVAGIKRRLAILIMSVMIGLLILMVVDLDRPNRGLIQVPVQALVDAAQGIPR
jgi:hypothetical protein